MVMGAVFEQPIGNTGQAEWRYSMDLDETADTVVLWGISGVLHAEESCATFGLKKPLLLHGKYFRHGSESSRIDIN
jgi:hypothetical protein